jgi:hypothetical protein
MPKMASCNYTLRGMVLFNVFASRLRRSNPEIYRKNVHKIF